MDRRRPITPDPFDAIVELTSTTVSQSIPERRENKVSTEKPQIKAPKISLDTVLGALRQSSFQRKKAKIVGQEFFEIPPLEILSTEDIEIKMRPMVSSDSRDGTTPFCILKSKKPIDK